MGGVPPTRRGGWASCEGGARLAACGAAGCGWGWAPPWTGSVEMAWRMEALGLTGMGVRFSDTERTRTIEGGG